jgi:hypothetical protein
LKQIALAALDIAGDDSESMEPKAGSPNDQGPTFTAGTQSPTVL